MHLTSEHASAASPSAPVTTAVRPAVARRAFADGAHVRRAPERLLELRLQGDRWQTPAHHVGDGAASSLVAGDWLEGIIAIGSTLPTPGAHARLDQVKNLLRPTWWSAAGCPARSARLAVRGACGRRSQDGELRYGARRHRFESASSPLAHARRPRAGRQPVRGRQPPRQTRFSSRFSSPGRVWEWTQAGTCATRATWACDDSSPDLELET